MEKQTTWLDGEELARVLEIRPSRLAQMMRAGLVPYQTSTGGPLVHVKDYSRLEELFGQLLAVFRVEKEVDDAVEDGGFPWIPQTYERPSTTKLLECVKRHEGSFPSGPAVPRKDRFPRKLSP